MRYDDEFLLFDGGMGTMLQERGLKAGSIPELYNISNPQIIKNIHKEYVDSGCDVITANTFGASRHKLAGKSTPDEVISAGVRLAKESGAKYTALDIGPTGALLKPLGTMSFDEAYSLFEEQVKAGAKAGADLIIIETMSDLLETKAAILAAKENCSLPVFATMTFDSDGRTFLGTDPKTAAIVLSSLGVDGAGVNCSLGPEELFPIVKEFVKYSKVPVIVQPNAGLPVIENGYTVFKITPDEFAESIKKMLPLGVSVVGGCCGTTPAHIAKLKKLIDGKKPYAREITSQSFITSWQKTVTLDNSTAIIGERINPTGKKKLKEALKARDYDYIIGEAISQQEAGADILDVNAGLPDIDEAKTLTEIIAEIQSVSHLPLQIDSTDPSAVEAAVRSYNGKPIINSVNGKEESLSTILPIVKKYGTAVVALTLDEDGIPDKAEKRLEIAEKILNRALSMGIPKEDIFIDCLVLTASTNQETVIQTLKAITLVKSKLGLKTVLGVSNVSFGLPAREVINSAFLAAAFGAGLDMPILNPLSEEYMKVVDAFKVLNNEDKGSVKFIEKYASVPKESGSQMEISDDLGNVILSGRKGAAQSIVKELLKSESVFDIINNRFIPALDIVGEKYEKGEFFLPQLMASAEVVKEGFAVLKEGKESTFTKGSGDILLATVKGDIHDIGKNIVKMLLENYGYNIKDLGRDVSPEAIVNAATQDDIKLVGLSALMTHTVKSMEETIKLLKESGANCKVMVGGAVLNEDYARMIGADFYAKDAAQAAKVASEVFKEK
ncbi:MAG: homocysteine S-methyltransferase family protein [Bacillota bacterium]|nr:homocysteine S-methyltransferase family protein [Bacillota bacterium]